MNKNKILFIIISAFILILGEFFLETILQLNNIFILTFGISYFCISILIVNRLFSKSIYMKDSIILLITIIIISIVPYSLRKSIQWFSNCDIIYASVKIPMIFIFIITFRNQVN